MDLLSRAIERGLRALADEADEDVARMLGLLGQGVPPLILWDEPAPERKAKPPAAAKKKRPQRRAKATKAKGKGFYVIPESELEKPEPVERNPALNRLPESGAGAPPSEAAELVNRLIEQEGSAGAAAKRFGFTAMVLGRWRAGQPCSPGNVQRLREALAMGPIRSRGKPSAPARGEPDEDQDDDDLETDPDETPEEIARGVEVIEATFREPARDARRQA